MENKYLIPSKEECSNSLNNIVDALFVIGGKWKLPIILDLMHSPKRFGELQRELNGISPKVLAKELKDLELNEFIKRNVSHSSPVIIIYEATEYSYSLKNVLKELSDWGFIHREKIKESMRK